MKKTFIYPALLTTALIFNACQSNQQASESTTPTDSSEILTNPSDVGGEEVVSDWLEKLVGSEEGLFRGVNLGDGVADVKGKETAEPFEEDAAHIGYTIEYENLETVDIQYFIDNNKKVKRIEVDIYLNNQQSVNTHRQELETYFTKRYGNPSQQSWKVPSNSLITLKDVSKGKDFGLKLIFSRGTSA